MLIFHKKYKNMNKNIITTIIKGYKIKYLKKKDEIIIMIKVVH